MSDFQLSDVLDNKKAEETVSVTVNGHDLDVGVVSPSHVRYMEFERLRAQRAEKLQEGDQMTPEDLTDPYDLIDEHVVTVEGQAWCDFDEDDRKDFVESLSISAFWDLVNGILLAGKLDDDEGND